MALNLMGVGPLAGFAYVSPEMELYKLKLEKERQAMEDRKVAYAITKDLSEMLEVGKVTNAYDHEKQTQFAAERIKYLGKYVRQNPDFMFNPEKYMEFKSLTRELKDNKWTRREESHKENVKLYMDAVQKNPLLLETPTYQAMAKQIQNRDQFGSINGTDDEAEFIYTPQQPWVSLVEKAQEMGKVMEKNYYTQRGPSDDPDFYGMWSADPRIIDSKVDALIKEHEEQFNVQYPNGQDGKQLLYDAMYGSTKKEAHTGRIRDMLTQEQLRLSVMELKAKSVGKQAPDHYAAQILPLRDKPDQATQLTPKQVEKWRGNLGPLSLYRKGDLNSFATLNSVKNISWTGDVRTNFDRRGEQMMALVGTGEISIEEAYEIGIIDTLEPEKGQDDVLDEYKERGRERREVLTNAVVIDDGNGKKHVRITGTQLVPWNDPAVAAGYNAIWDDVDVPNADENYNNAKYGPRGVDWNIKDAEIFVPDETGQTHRLVSSDGLNWIDPETGKRLSPGKQKLDMTHYRATGELKWIDLYK